MSARWGCLAQAPATWRWWSLRLRARRFGRLREAREHDHWLTALRGCVS